MLQQNLAALCSRLQLVLPPCDAEGRVAVTFVGLSPLHFVPLPGGGTLLECVVASLPEGEGEAATREQLCRRALGMAMGRTLREWGQGFVPCLVASARDIRLQMRLKKPSNHGFGTPLVDQSYFEGSIERFLNVAETWQTLLASTPAPPVLSTLAANSNRMLRFAGLWP